MLNTLTLSFLGSLVVGCGEEKENPFAEEVNMLAGSSSIEGGGLNRGAPQNLGRTVTFQTEGVQLIR